jgi:hypothetical protein
MQRPPVIDEGIQSFVYFTLDKGTIRNFKQFSPHTETEQFNTEQY